MMLALAVLTSIPSAVLAEVEPQPLPDGVADSGINVLLDSSHQFSFHNHWQVQDTIRNAGHRVTGNQASLQYALVPGTPMRVRDQEDHAWGGNRPFIQLPAPEFDVVFTYQSGKSQPYLPAERKTLKQFVKAGGGLIMQCSNPEAHLAEVAQAFGSRLLPDAAEVNSVDDVPGLDALEFPTTMRVAAFSAEWQVVVGEGGAGALAWRSYGKGTVVLIVDGALAVARVDDRNVPNADLLDWAVRKAAEGASPRDDGRWVPWEYGGLGGAFYPENEIEVGGVSVLFADNQLPDIVELAKERFTEVMDTLQIMLPTPPNPGDAYYINLAAGNGGGWAENAITPKLAGTISTNHESILSILAHELAHTMYGPAAVDGTAGVGLPAWFSEAHAGWFQRKTMMRLGYMNTSPYFNVGVARQDPLLDDIDLANIPEGGMGAAWHKVWFIWSVLDGRYGEQWYPNWLKHVHDKYSGTDTKLDMDGYIMSISESVGEDVAPLFERFGTTVGERTELPPVGPPE